MDTIRPTHIPPLAVVGVGRAGRDLMHLARSAGVEIAFAWSRSGGGSRVAGVLVQSGDVGCIEAGLVILAVPDEAIEGVARHLGEQQLLVPGATLAHLSGVAPASRLRVAGACHPCVSMHPLQTLLGDGRVRQPFPWILEGDEDAVTLAESVVDVLGCTSVQLPGAGKARYHAAATMASNLLVALVHMVDRQAARAGIPRSRLPGLFRPLMESTLEHVMEHDALHALTGPIQRGDVDTVRTHLQALGDSDEDRATYARLSLQLVDMAVEGGLDEDKASQLRRWLTEAGCSPLPGG